MTVTTSAPAGTSVIGGELPVNIRTVGTLSGGGASWAACRRWIDINGPDDMVLLFTDVSGNATAPMTGEHPDTLRFLGDAAANLGVPLVIIRDGWDIWDVFEEKKWLGNSQLAHCSWELKTTPAREWVTKNAPGAERILVGIDVTEADRRLPDITSKWEPFRAVAPLTDKPTLWKPQIRRMLREHGLRPSLMYSLGFAHANCPACVKAGMPHWIRLWLTLPDLYLYAERREEEHRAKFGDVAILRDRSADPARPLPLRELRERVQAGERLSLFGEGQFAWGDVASLGFGDQDGEEGGCACFT